MNQRILIKNILYVMQEPLFALYARWLDERQFEDFADYRERVRELFAPLTSATFENMDKRFNITFVIDGGRYQIRVRTRRYTCVRLKEKALPCPSCKSKNTVILNREPDGPGAMAECNDCLGAFEQNFT